VLAQHTWSSLPPNQCMTFTAGIAAISGTNLIEALRQADMRLYDGKANGRDSIWY
jgi:PleD family two-component response regulator